MFNSVHALSPTLFTALCPALSLSPVLCPALSPALSFKDLFHAHRVEEEVGCSVPSQSQPRGACVLGT